MKTGKKVLKLIYFVDVLTNVHSTQFTIYLICDVYTKFVING